MNVFFHRQGVNIIPLRRNLGKSSMPCKSHSETSPLFNVPCGAGLTGYVFDIRTLFVSLLYVSNNSNELPERYRFCTLYSELKVEQRKRPRQQGGRLFSRTPGILPFHFIDQNWCICNGFSWRCLHAFNQSEGECVYK